MDKQVVVVPLSTKFLHYCASTAAQLRKILPLATDYMKYIDADFQNDDLVFDYERFRDEMGETYYIVSSIREFALDCSSPIIKHSKVKGHKTFDIHQLTLDLLDFAGLYQRLYKYFECVEPLFKFVAKGLEVALSNIVSAIENMVNNFDENISVFENQLIGIYQQCEDLYTYARLMHTVSYIYGPPFKNIKEYSRLVSNIFIIMHNFAAVTNYLIDSQISLKYRLYLTPLASMGLNERLRDPEAIDTVTDVWDVVDPDEVDHMSMLYILHPDEYERKRKYHRHYVEDLTEYPIDDILEHDVDGDLIYLDNLSEDLYVECEKGMDWFEEC